MGEMRKWMRWGWGLGVWGSGLGDLARANRFYVSFLAVDESSRGCGSVMPSMSSSL